MKLNRIARAVLAAAAAAGLVVGVINPAHSAAKTTVSIVQSNALTGLNPSVQEYNLTFNTDVAYLSGIGFTYYNNQAQLVDNKAFGTYKIVSQKPFKVKYTVNPGRTWSDGTPINGIDLLLTHVVSTAAYSVIAGLGDPNDAKVTPAFLSGGYGGIYDEHVVGLPILSPDKMSVTIEYDTQVPDWKLLAPGPTPVHTLVLMEEGKTKLGTIAENNAARERFYKYFQDYNTTHLKAIGKIWSEDYNINKVDASTNPLLLVGNGPFIVKTAVPNGAVTMVRNAKYNSGPKVKSLQTVVFKVIGDGTAAAQALKNGEVDVYAGQPTADAVAQLKAMAPAVKVIGGDQAVYEHIDLRVGPAYGTTDSYNGPFAGDSQKAKDLRTAFLLAYPRQEIMDKIVKPINSTATLMNSLLVFPKEPGYADMVAKNGSSKFTSGTQDDRTAQALALVKKYYPDASATNGAVKVRLLWGQPTNARRAAEAALVKAALAKAGFDVNTTGTSGWSRYLADPSYDAMFFAWVKSAITQKGNADLFCTKCDNNSLGYSNATVDKLVEELGAKQLSDKERLAKYLAVETQVMADGVSLPIFQHPAVTAINSALKGINPGPLAPNLEWNFWQWKY